MRNERFISFNVYIRNQIGHQIGLVTHTSQLRNALVNHTKYTLMECPSIERNEIFLVISVKG